MLNDVGIFKPAPKCSWNIHLVDAFILLGSWYHHVSQESDSRSEVQGQPGGLCVAINWWYEVSCKTKYQKDAFQD